MRKILAVIITILSSNLCFSQIVQQEQAFNAAFHFIQRLTTYKNKGLNKVSSVRALTGNYATIKQYDRGLGYVFELRPEGFVITSNNRFIEPIIAYSFSGHFRNAADTNAIICKLVVSDLELREAFLINSNEKTKIDLESRWIDLINHTSFQDNDNEFIQWPDMGATKTGGWVDVTWDQLNPYNGFCPIDTSKNLRSLTGCTATAWSQLLNYFRPDSMAHLDLQNRYITRTRKIKIDQDSTKCLFPSFSKLNQYLNRINDAFENNLVLDDTLVSVLNFYVGILSEMDYTFGGSGAGIFNLFWNPKAQLFSSGREFRGFGASDWNEFYPVLKSNMMNGLPAILTILSSKIPTPGHAIICDGYNTDDFYHLNFGWGNAPDEIIAAWYHLPEGMPAEMDMIEEAIVDLSTRKHNRYPFSISKSHFQLGGVKLGAHTKSQSFSISNSISQTIILSSIDVSAGFAISTDDVNFSNKIGAMEIPPHSAQRFYLRGFADTLGLYLGKAVMSVRADHDKEYLYQLDLRMKGIETDGTIILPGTISGVWTKEGSPYLITGDVSVELHSTLRIEPGVDVVFEGKYKFSVPYARLLAIGTEQDSIRFYPRDAETGWFGLDFYDNRFSIFRDQEETNSLFYCSISGGRSNGAIPQDTGGGIYIRGASVTIKNCHIFNNSARAGAGMFIGSGPAYSPVRISNTLIERNISSGQGIITIGYTESSKDAMAIFENVNIVNNQSQHECAIAAINHGNRVDFINCIMWNNFSDSKYLFLLGYDCGSLTLPDTLNLSYCDIDTADYKLANYWVVKPMVNCQVGNLDLDPKFMDNTSFQLSSTSPCIDAGDPSAEYFDQESLAENGVARYPAQGTLTNDMGIYGGGVYNLPLNPPALHLPEDNSTFVPNANGWLQTLVWSTRPVYTYYLVQIARDSSFCDILISDSSLVSTINISVPKATCNYFWRVRGKTKIAQLSDWSHVRRFSTNYELPPAPSLAEPVNGAKDMALTLTLRWSAIAGAISYHLQVSTNVNFKTTAVQDSTLTVGSRTIGPLKSEMTYYWRVRAKNYVGYSDFSLVSHFHTTEATLVERLSDALPLDYKLSQNYPNPFNPCTAIQFALPKASEVTLKVYDLLGQDVANLVSQRMHAGYYTVRWHPNLANGTYLYRLQAGAFVEIKKMILLR